MAPGSVEHGRLEAIPGPPQMCGRTRRQGLPCPGPSTLCSVPCNLGFLPSSFVLGLVSHYVAQAGLELTAVLLPQLLGSGISGMTHTRWLHATLPRRCQPDSVIGM